LLLAASRLEIRIEVGENSIDDATAAAVFTRDKSCC